MSVVTVQLRYKHASCRGLFSNPGQPDELVQSSSENDMGITEDAARLAPVLSVVPAPIKWNEFVKPQANNLIRVLRSRKQRGVMGALPRDVLLLMKPPFHPWGIDDRYLIEAFRDYDPMRELAARA